MNMISLLVLVIAQPEPKFAPDIREPITAVVVGSQWVVTINGREHRVSTRQDRETAILFAQKAESSLATATAPAPLFLNAPPDPHAPAIVPAATSYSPVVIPSPAPPTATRVFSVTPILQPRAVACPPGKT